MNTKFILSLICIALVVSCKKDESSPTVHVKIVDTPYKGDLYDIYFVDNDNGFMVGEFDNYGNRKSVMLRTANGGETWTVDTFNLTNSRVIGITGYNSKLFISTIYQRMIGNPERIYYSSDSGYNWILLDSIHNGKPFFLNESDGFLLYDSKILKTVNAGLRWVEIYEAQYLAPLSQLQFVNSNVGYVKGGSTYDNTNYGYMLKTTDGGKTWADLNLGMTNITDMHFISESSGYLFTYNNELFKTVNGGQTWQMVNGTINSSYPSSHFFSEANGCFTTNHGVYFTGNGGVNWKLCYYNAGITLQRSYFINQSIGFAYGNDGIILKITYN